MTAFYGKNRERHINLIKKHFIPYLGDSYLLGDAGPGFDNSEVGGNRFNYVTAAGKPLCEPDTFQNMGESLEKAFEEFQKLPEAERKPKMERSGKGSSEKAPPAPPGGLIARIYFTYLDRDAKGEPSRSPWLKGGEFGHVSNIAEPALTECEMFWTTPEEEKSWLPAQFKKGDTFPVPASVQKRIFLLHAQDYRANDRADTSLRAGELTQTVENVSPTGVTLRLDGYARTGVPFEAYKSNQAKIDMVGHDENVRLGCDMRFLGFLHYDIQKKAFDRFDVVGLGHAWGEYTNIWRSGANEGKPGPWLIGIAFERVSTNRPIDRIPPIRACAYTGYDYFGNAKSEK